jgi:hypothetical protein
MVPPVLLLAAVLLGLGFGPVSVAVAEPGDDGGWPAGSYSYSDELGGFTIHSATGSGTRDDPAVVAATLHSSSPVTMTIRAIRPIRPFERSDRFANGIIYLRVEVRNGSRQGWVEFEFELQEQLNVPSTFGDGLSFDQRAERQQHVASDTFARFSRSFEPSDQLRFWDGKVDPGRTAGFSFLLTDYTPRWLFYLVLDPRIPFS